MQIHFLQITWGDIIILKDGDAVALIDTGYDKNFEQIRDYLDGLGVRKIDFLLLSHFHIDHYGSIKKLVEHYPVDRVYLKEYSCLDKSTAGGKVADEDYRNQEMAKWLEIKEAIDKHSRYVRVEDVKTIDFGSTQLRLFRNENIVRKVYEDSSVAESYHTVTLQENHNSLAAFMTVNGVNILFAGDIVDGPTVHPMSSYGNYQIAASLKEELDIYKVPHHGTRYSNEDRTLAIYKPKIAVITNEEEYLKNSSTIYEDLRRANPDVRVLLTEKHNVVITVTENGGILCDET